MNYNKILHF